MRGQRREISFRGVIITFRNYLGFGIIGLTSWFGIYKGADVIARSTVASEPNPATHNSATNLQAETKKDKTNLRPTIKSND